MPRLLTSRADTPPSRYGNPFATCWTQPGRLAFRFDDGQSAEHLVAKLGKQQWRGAIVGPHGSGKSTLLESLKPAIVSAGRHVRAIALHDGQRRLPRHFFKTKVRNSNSVFIVDGYEQLGCAARVCLWLRCRLSEAGLLVTSHSSVHLPTLIRLSPDRRLIEQLVAELCAKVSTSVTCADIAASHACHDSNVRDILFDLYDRHEERHRTSNSSLAPP